MTDDNDPGTTVPVTVAVPGAAIAAAAARLDESADRVDARDMLLDYVEFDLDLVDGDAADAVAAVLERADAPD